MAVQRGPWQRQVNSPQYDEFESFSPADWQGSTPPPRDWIVQDCFPKGSVCILAGDGGLGKSLLIQQLCTAAALGRQWLGFTTKRARSLALFCEDDRDELQRRQDDINAHYRCEMSDLEDTMFIERPGRDSVMMRFGKWGDEGQTTKMFEWLTRQARDFGAQIVCLDTVADVFSGNEIDRNQPRTFVRALRRLAIELQGVVILTQHPSVQGMAEGSGRSGSTGWRNSIRSMLYLTKDKDDTKPNLRVLKTMKMNAGPAGRKVSLTWQRGVFVRTELAGPSYGMLDEPYPA